MRDPSRLSDPASNHNFSRDWGGGRPDIHLNSERPALAPPLMTITKVVDDTSSKAIRHWLQQADDLDGEERIVALETADAIMRMTGLRWGDFKLRRAA